MSRIGNMPITIPDKVQVNFDGNLMKTKGPKGQLELTIPEGIEYNLAENILTFTRTSEQKKIKALHGLTRALANNVVVGVSEGFEKKLLIEGVGYKAEMKDERLLLSLGYSHPILLIPPDDIQFETPSATQIIIKGISKQQVGQWAAKIRKLRPPEPYKGKGIRYEGEYIRRKAGKTAA